MTNTARQAGRDHREPRLTLNVNEVPEAVQERSDGTERELVVGTVKVSGSFRVDRDLDRREEFTVTIADADGLVVATGLAVAGGPKFVDIEDKGRVLGVERQHSIKVVDGSPA